MNTSHSFRHESDMSMLDTEEIIPPADFRTNDGTSANATTRTLQDSNEYYLEDSRLTPDDLFTQQSLSQQQQQFIDENRNHNDKCDGGNTRNDSNLSQTQKEEEEDEDDVLEVDDDLNRHCKCQYDDIQEQAMKWQCQLEAELDHLYMLRIQNSILLDRLAMIGAYDDDDDDDDGYNE
jgi:hypothetical protein